VIENTDFIALDLESGEFEVEQYLVRHYELEMGHLLLLIAHTKHTGMRKYALGLYAERLLAKLLQ